MSCVVLRCVLYELTIASNRLRAELRDPTDGGDGEDDGAFSNDDAYEEYEELVSPVAKECAKRSTESSC